MKIFSKHFPYISLSHVDRMRHVNMTIPNHQVFSNKVVCSIGGNIANCIQTFEQLFMFLHKHPKITIYATSYIYKNAAFGYTKQPDFYNTSFILHTSLCLKNIFSLLFYLERKFGRMRKREYKNSARSLDIDIVFYNNKTVHFNHLRLPHIDYTNRTSVLVPLRFQLGLDI